MVMTRGHTLVWYIDDPQFNNHWPIKLTCAQYEEALKRHIQGAIVSRRERGWGCRVGA